METQTKDATTTFFDHAWLEKIVIPRKRDQDGNVVVEIEPTQTEAQLYSSTPFDPNAELPELPIEEAEETCF